MILTLHFSSCLFMTGLIWLIQLVHYPSFAYVDKQQFAAFSAFHSRTITYIVLPIMGLELVTAGWLVWQTPDVIFGANLVGVLLIWAATFFLSVPYHGQLAAGWDARAARMLVLTNWPRTILWTVRSAVFVLGYVQPPVLG